MTEKLVFKVCNVFTFFQVGILFFAVNLLPVSYLIELSFGWLIIIPYTCVVFYLLSIIYVKKAYFYEHFFIIKYPTRLFKKQLIIEYSEIIRVRHYGRPVGSSAKIAVKYKTRKFPVWIAISDDINRLSLLTIIEKQGVQIIGTPINKKFLENNAQQNPYNNL